MKKVVAICLMMVMVLSMSVNVFAAPGGFVSSPSGNPAPTVVEVELNNAEFTGSLVVKAYGDRHDLPDALLTTFEKAYNDIVNSDDLTKLNAELAKIASDKDINSADLAVSDLFDIHVTGYDNHGEHVEFEITLDADTLDRFVGLLHMNKNGVWELVADAEVVNDGEHLKFSVDSFSPFAIVVNTGVDTPDAPPTGDNSMIHIYVIIMAISAIAIIVIAVKSKKQRV